MFWTKKLWLSVLHVVRNLFYITQLNNIDKINYDNIVISGVSRKELKDIYAVYARIYNNKYPKIQSRIVYFFLSQKCVFSAKEKTTGKIIGIMLFYKTKRDVIENTIHIGFTGILPEFQGQKIGTKITVHSVNHFKKSNLNGISTRISLNNLPSLKTYMGLGFKPVDKYFDKKINEERYYLICPFNSNFC